MYKDAEPIGVFQGLIQKRHFISGLEAGDRSSVGMSMVPQTENYEAFLKEVVARVSGFSYQWIVIPTSAEIPGYLTSRSYNVRLDLSKRIEDLMGSMRKETRWSVRKAKALGIRVDVSSSEDSLRKTCGLISATARRRGHRPLGLRWMLALNEGFSKVGHSMSAVATQEGELASAGFFIGYDDKISWIASGSTSMGYKTQSNSLIQWVVIEWGKENGYHTYDMGAADPTPSRADSFQRFKSTFGGQITSYFCLEKNAWYMPILRTAYTAKTKAQRYIGHME
jgi:lipid II:glycine glycyltransferase (peptidoglycan interpeptide bridge formation enzyme)